MDMIFNDAPRILVVVAGSYKQRAYCSCAHYLAVVIPCFLISGMACAGNVMQKFLKCSGVCLKLLPEEFVNTGSFMSRAMAPTSFKPAECGHEGSAKFNNCGTIGILTVDMKQGQGTYQTSQ